MDHAGPTVRPGPEGVFVGRAESLALLTSGVLGGGSRGYDYRVDLRVVYL